MNAPSTHWPTPASAGRCAITAVASSTKFTVNSTTLPIAGVSSISMLDPLTWTLFQARVIAYWYTGTKGAFAVTVQTDAPLKVAVGNDVFPSAATINEVHP